MIKKADRSHRRERREKIKIKKLSGLCELGGKKRSVTSLVYCVCESPRICFKVYRARAFRWD